MNSIFSVEDMCDTFFLDAGNYVQDYMWPSVDSIFLVTIPRPQFSHPKGGKQQIVPQKKTSRGMS